MLPSRMSYFLATRTTDGTIKCLKVGKAYTVVTDQTVLSAKPMSITGTIVVISRIVWSGIVQSGEGCILCCRVHRDGQEESVGRGVFDVR